jgi:P27 family predicted phage terminase small subunit
MIAQAKMDQGSEHPLLVRGSTGTLMPSPYLRILNQSAELMLRCATEMGLTPSSRPRLAGAATQEPTPPASDSPWAKLRLLQGGGKPDDDDDDDDGPQAA